MDVFAETLFVSVCRHAYPDAAPDDPGVVRVEFEYRPNPPALEVRIADEGAPYDPLAEIDLAALGDTAEAPGNGQGDAEESRIVDEAVYERVGESNVVSFTKSW